MDALAALLIGGAQAGLRRLLRALVLALFACAAALAATGFLTAALWLWLRRLLGPLEAALAMGGGLAALAVLLAVLAAVTARRRSARRRLIDAARREGEGADVLALLGLAADDPALAAAGTGTTLPNRLLVGLGIGLALAARLRR